MENGIVNAERTRGRAPQRIGEILAELFAQGQLVASSIAANRVAGHRAEIDRIEVPNVSEVMEDSSC